MTTSYTPGPWGISSQSPRIIKQYDGLGETNVIIGSASGYPQSGFYPSDELAIKNALLIAAAPELLEALKQLLSYGLKMSAKHEAPAFEAARSAIAKATGAA